MNYVIPATAKYVVAAICIRIMRYIDGGDNATSETEQAADACSPENDGGQCLAGF